MRILSALGFFSIPILYSLMVLVLNVFNYPRTLEIGDFFRLVKLSSFWPIMERLGCDRW
jgi:hypothetical protein